MAQENITVKVDLDTTGFERAMQALINSANDGASSIADAIITASGVKKSRSSIFYGEVV